MGNSLTLKLPMAKTTMFPGGFEMIDDYKDLVAQNLKNLILTIPGEKIMDSGFGVGLKTFLFEQNNQTTYGQIRAKILEQVSIYLPYIEVLEVEIELSSRPNSISMNVKYRILPLEVIDYLDITVLGD